MNSKKFLWLTPFFSFTLGYLVVQSIFRTPEINTPHLVGKHVHEVLALVTQHNLNIRLINHKEEADVQEGIILNQTPAAGSTIKSHQPVFIVTSKKPCITRAPQCVGISMNELSTQLHNSGINPRIYYLPHVYPENVCCAQSPQHHEPLEKNKLIVYVSAGNNKPIIWPDFTHISLDEVTEFLHAYNIEPEIITDTLYKEYTHHDYTVIDQRPFAGTLLTIDEKKPLSVQLRVH